MSHYRRCEPKASQEGTTVVARTVAVRRFGMKASLSHAQRVTGDAPLRNASRFLPSTIRQRRQSRIASSPVRVSSERSLERLTEPPIMPVMGGRGRGFLLHGCDWGREWWWPGVGLVMEHRSLMLRFGAEPGSRFRDSCDGSGPLEALWDRSLGRRVGPRFAARSDVHRLCGGHTDSSALGTRGPLRT